MTGRYSWPRAKICCRFLVGVHVGFLYLGQDQPQLESRGGHALWIRRDPVDGVDGVVVAR